MNNGRFLGKLSMLTALMLLAVLSANAQQGPSPDGSPQQTPAQPSASVSAESGKVQDSFVESGGSYEILTNNYGHWSGGYIRGVLDTGKNTWNAEVNGQHQFGDGGTYMGAGDTYNFNDNWYGALTLGSSVGGFFWPRFRADGFLNRKWASRKQFITTAGFGYFAAKDVHRDSSAFVGTTYYFDKPWILEDGVRFNVSNPGEVFAPYGFVAITEGRNKQHYLTVNYGFGREGYQLIGPTTVLTQFESQTATITWRQWAGRSWGFNVVAEYYSSPFYRRSGGSFGFFKEF